MLTLRTLIQLINTFCSIRCFLNQNSIFKNEFNFYYSLYCRKYHISIIFISIIYSIITVLYRTGLIKKNITFCLKVNFFPH